MTTPWLRHQAQIAQMTTEKPLDDERDRLVFRGAPLGPEFIDAASAEPIHALGPLRRVNVLVGANSSGKSRLLRELSSREQYVLASGTEFERLTGLVNLAGQCAADGAAPFIFHNSNQGHIQPVTVHPSDFAGISEHLLHAVHGREYREPSPGAAGRILALSKTTSSRTGGTAHLLGEVARFDGALEFAGSLSKLRPARLFVPPLRTAHSLWTREYRREHEPRDHDARIHEDILETTVRRQYFSGQGAPQVWTGFSLYKRLIEMQCARQSERAKKHDFERFMSHTFFGGRSTEFVAQLGERPNQPFDSHVNVVIEGEERELFHVGDGVGAVAALLFPLFAADDETWVFIEEPELHLHPAYQRVFLEALLNEEALLAKKLRVFLTTHSNHLLDIAIERPDDVAVFSFAPGEKAPSISVRQTQGPDIRLLDDLGVRNGSVFLANCSIWVEGPSDVAYVRAFLAARMRVEFNEVPFLEDLHYAFIQYGGSLISNYGFRDRDEEPEADEEHRLDLAVSANRVFLLADKDSGKEKKHELWASRAARSGGALRYLTTGGREIENDVPVELLRRAVRARLQMKGELPEIALRAPIRSDERIGDYLARELPEDLVGSKAAKQIQNWRDSSGAIKYDVKGGFARTVARELEKAGPSDVPSLLSGAASDLADSLIEFISRHNPHVRPRRRLSP